MMQEPRRSGFRMERRLILSGALVACGLLIQLLMHLWVHPLAFMGFLAVGTPLVLIGVLFFLFSLVGDREQPGGGSPSSEA